MEGTGGLFVLCLVFWAFAGFGVTIVGATVLMIATENPQGPLVHIFLGPIGFANGAVVGTGMWRLLIKDKQSLRTTAGESSGICSVALSFLLPHLVTFLQLSR